MYFVKEWRNDYNIWFGQKENTTQNVRDSNWRTLSFDEKFFYYFPDWAVS